MYTAYKIVIYVTSYVGCVYQFLLILKQFLRSYKGLFFLKNTVYK